MDASGKRMLYAVAQGVDLAKPNLDELEHILGKKFTCKEDMLSGCYELLDRGVYIHQNGVLRGCFGKI